MAKYNVYYEPEYQEDDPSYCVLEHKGEFDTYDQALACIVEMCNSMNVKLKPRYSDNFVEAYTLGTEIDDSIAYIEIS